MGYIFQIYIRVISANNMKLKQIIIHYFEIYKLEKVLKFKNRQRLRYLNVKL